MIYLPYLPAVAVAALCFYAGHNPLPFLVLTIVTGSLEVAQAGLPKLYIDRTRQDDAVHALLRWLLWASALACGWWAAQ